METNFDVVIIGSGAGGAPIAHELAKLGKKVLILEKGPLFLPQQDSENGRSDFKRDEQYSDGCEKRLQIPGVKNTGASYYSSHVEPDLNDEPHVYRDNDGDRVTIEGYTAQVVGGGTQLYGGVSFRFSPNDFKLQSYNAGRTLKNDPNGDVEREARDWPISYDDLEPYYAEAEEKIGINGTQECQIKPFSRPTYQPPLDPNPISDVAMRGMVELAKQLNPQNPLLPYRTPLAVITRDHAPSGRKGPPLQPAAGANPPYGETAKTSYVNRYGDPLAYKSSTWAALLRPIIKLPNFFLRTNCVVTRLTCSKSRVNAVYYRDPSGIEKSVTGRFVVVACSAIESIRLLKLSAIADSEFDRGINQNDLLGKYFLTHAFGGASAIIPAGARVDKSRALDADWASDCCATDAYMKDNQLWASGFIYNNTSDEALPLSLFRTMDAQDLDTLWNGFMSRTDLRGDQIMKYMDDTYGRGISITFMANQIPQKDNRIELHPTVTDKWNRPVAYVIKNWHAHDKYLMDTYALQCKKILDLGAQQLGWGADSGFNVLGYGGSYQASNGLARIANHILGGARFGNSAKDSVLDKNCRTWGIDNLFVTDGAFMPSSGSGNPTNTIEANSFRVADVLEQML